VPIISPGFRAAVVNQEKLQIVVGAAAPIGLNRKRPQLTARCSTCRSSMISFEPNRT
jgi:hypothetical protein